jgi:hypothetical protein
MTLATEKSRKRKWTLDISEVELRLKLRRRVGKTYTCRPKPGTEKSTKICVYDIALLARANLRGVRNFLYGKPNIPGHSTCGQKTLARIDKVLDMVNAGLILKTQYGSYHFYETPQVKPVVTRTVNLDTGRITGAVSTTKAPQKMPSFTTVFGDRK